MVKRKNGTRTHKVRSLCANRAYNICDPRKDAWTGNASTIWSAVDCKRCLAKKPAKKREQMITKNMIELWKVENSNTYMNWVGLYGYDRAQERVLAILECSRLAKESAKTGGARP